MFLKKLVIDNFRSIEHIEIDFTTDTADLRKWTLILGENGAGKSSILRALGLLLAGSEALPELLGNSDLWIRLGQSTCNIAADLVTSDDEPRHIELQLQRGHTIRDLFKSTETGLGPLDRALARTQRNYFTIGYGVSRRLNNAPSSTITNDLFRQPRAQSVATLFSSDATLNPLEAWAIDLDYRREVAGREVIQTALAGLLPGVDFETIDREKRQLMFNTPDGKLPLSQLSDGYQNVAAWCGDLLFRVTNVFDDYKDPFSVRGLLLIDEIDLHLHPIWKRQLVDFLTTKLPNFQIIATTHSPLTVQQAGEGELFVLRREEPHKPPTLYAYPGIPRNMMLHQLLLSPIFGLTTIDSKLVEDRKNEYRTLEAKTRHSKEDKRRLGELQVQLEDLPDWSVESPHEQRQRELLEKIEQSLTAPPRK